MFSRISTHLFAVLRIPPAPTAPWGAPGSERIFRAGRKFYWLRLLVWSIGQIATAFGIVISLGFLTSLKHDVDRYRAEQSPATQQQPAPPQAVPATAPGKETSGPSRYMIRPGSELPPELQVHARRLAQKMPWWLFPGIAIFEFGSVLLYLVQLPITYALVRLEYEQRWYIVTDRSLRIRSGLISLQETTMSFANVQQVTVTQGPVERLLGIANVQVRSAGGGSGGGEHEKPHADSMHSGVFHGVDNALEIRDLILERLRQYRAAGLGDPEESHLTAPISAESTAHAVAAARELLAEVRALRGVWNAP